MDRAVRMKPGDWVIGHHACYDSGDAVIRGRIADVSKSGRTVAFEIDPTLAAILRLPKRTTFTYRSGSAVWIQKGARPSKGEGGLYMVRRS